MFFNTHIGISLLLPQGDPPTCWGEELRSSVAHTTLSAETGVGVPNLGWCFNDGYSQVPPLPTPRE